jgi:hypothetical protein
MDRQPSYFAILNSAQRLVLKAFVELGALDPTEAARLADDNRSALLQVVQGQAGRIAEQSPANMLLRAIDSLLEQGKAYLAPRKNVLGWIKPERSEFVGWYDPADPGAVWLQVDAALTVAMYYWQRLGINFDMSRDAIKRALAQSGMLRSTGDGGRAEVAIWTGSRTQRAIEIDVAKVAGDGEWGYDLSYPKSEPGDAAPLREDLL